MPKLIPLLAAMLPLYSVCPSAASVEPGFPFQHHAVLQAGKPLPVWGSARPGERVTVQFGALQAATVADAGGRWRVVLPPLPASGAAARMSIAGDTTVVLEDVLVGEVWLCAGQSNMAFRLAQSLGGPERAAAHTDGRIRQLGVAQALHNTPRDTASGSWVPAAPDTAGAFSAVCYFYAAELAASLGVPVGIVNTTWGGTEIEAWIAPQAYADPALGVVQQRWQARLADYPAARQRYLAELAEEDRKEAAARARGESYQRAVPWEPANPDGSPHRAKAANIYNAMVHPVAGYAMAGVLWYQGESNAVRGAEYGALLPRLVHSWRAAFGQGALPFYWVQLPNYEAGAGRDWAAVRAGQAATLSLPNTAQAVALDLGEDRELHPPAKQAVGHRLALVALARHYGKLPAGAASGPTAAGCSSAGGVAAVSFDSAHGLAVRGAALEEFELAGEDGRFVPAQAVLAGREVQVRAQGLARPAAVRYAWRNAPRATLFDQAGLPAAPFTLRCPG